MGLRHVIFAAALAAFASGAKAAEVTTGEVTRLIANARAGVVDRPGWALDLLDALRGNGIEANRENACAVIAVIAQESGFVADPAVPGLGKMSEAALGEKLHKYPVAGNIALRWLNDKPTADASFMDRIRGARTEHDLDRAYRSLVDYLGEQSGLAAIANLGLLNRIIEERNDIDTAGSMQVSVKFAIDSAKKQRWLPMMLADVYAVREQLYTRQGGMYYGAAQLLGYETGYSRKLYRFADYNAGRYASRNAALQMVVQKLSGETLALDGDFLSYASTGKASPTPTATEKAVLKAVAKHALGLSEKDVRKDLLKEKTPEFVKTATFLKLRAVYRLATGQEAPFAIVPDIRLSSPKITHMMTTRIFAESVERRYQACMKVK